MKCGGKELEVVRTSGNFTGFVRDEEGTRFSLEPTLGNKGGFPVHVYLDGQTVNPVVVQGPHWEGDKGFQSLKIDAAPGGGVPGDTWRLFVGDETVNERVRFKVNSEGFISTREAGGRVLFDFDSRNTVTGDPFLEIIDGGEGTYYANPGANAMSATMGNAFDVSECKQVLLAVEQPNVDSNVPAWSFILSALGSATATGAPLKEITCGTAGQFGRAGVPAWDDQPGYLLLGASTADSGQSWALVPTYFPCLRFKAVKASNTMSYLDWQALYNAYGYYLRITAIAY